MASPPATRSPDFQSSGTKRKRGPSMPTYYAVKVGSKPGVYHTWKECHQQVNGVKSAIYKKFETMEEAETFLGIGNHASTQKCTATPTKFYAVRNGHQPGIYTDWLSASEQVRGYMKPAHKRFDHRNEAEAYMRGEAGPDREGDSAAASKGKKAKKNSHIPDATEIDADVPPGTGPLPEGSIDGFDSRLILNPVTGKVDYKTKEQQSATKMASTGVVPGAPLRIYTDGSALGNGAYGAIAGVGVYFGPSDSRNVSEALAGNRQTNQRAELTAVKRAIEIAPIDRHVMIVTDSQYSINCATKWYKKWKDNGWQTSDRKPVENRDLIEPIVKKIEERRKVDSETNFEWVKGHAGDLGNTAADHLAVQGSHSNHGQG